MSMWNWITKRRPERTGPGAVQPDAVSHEQAPDAPVVPVVPVQRYHARSPGRYGSLHAHLERRYADIVVLTFKQIEDLLGFPLPALARTRREWWTSDIDGEHPPQSDAWKLAGRTATPNLSAKTVAFERALGL